MATIQYEVRNNVQRMTIGVQGENNVREFLFDVTEWRQITGDIGTAEMVVQRNGDASPYAAAITMHDENTVSWIPTSTDTAKVGAGKLQLMWIASGQTVKTKIFDMKVDPSLDYAVPDTSLDPWASWMPGIINADANYKGLTSRVDDLQQRQTSPYNFKGSCAEADLPSSAEINDTWYLTDLKYRVTWTGSAWQQSSMAETDYTDDLAALDAKSMLTRRNLVANEDIDALTDPGHYFKSLGVSVLHGVNTNACRLLVMKASSSSYAAAQLWFDAVDNKIYYRLRRGSNFSWPAWKRLTSEGEELIYHAEGRTEPGGIGVISGQTSGYLSNGSSFVACRSEMQYACLPGASVQLQFYGGFGGDAVGLAYYDADNAYLSTTTHTPEAPFFTVPAGAYYFKVLTTDNDGAAIRRETFSVHSNRPVAALCNPAIKNSSVTGSLAFVYQVGEKLASGRLLLPPNYSTTGAKTPLIVFVHGSNCLVEWSGIMGQLVRWDNSQGAVVPTGESYLPCLEYLADEGFAVFDCYPYPMPTTVAAYVDSPFCVPPCIDSYLDGIRYVCSRFNVDIDRVSMLCKSQGGHIGSWAVTQHRFPFKAVGLFAPSCGIGTTGGGLLVSRNCRSLLRRLVPFDATAEEITAFVEYGRIDSTADGQLVQSFCDRNQGVLTAMSPSVHGITNGNLADLYSGSVTARASVPQWMADLGLPPKPDGASALYTLSSHEEYVKNADIPSKFWAAFDDDQVPAYSVYAVYHWLRNGGSDTSFRELPIGTGGHHAMDTAEEALKSSGTTALGISYTDIPTAYVEAAAFIRDKGGA